METAHFIVCPGAFDPNQVVKYKAKVIDAESQRTQAVAEAIFGLISIYRQGNHAWYGWFERDL